MCIAHAQFTCKCILPLFGFVRGAYWILVNLISGGSWPLVGISTNLFLSVSTVTVTSWRHGFLSMTCRTCTLLSGWSFLLMICKLWSHCSYCKHNLHNYCGALWWMPYPLLPEMTIIIYHNMDIYIEWHNIINGNRKKHQSLLLRGIFPGPSPSSPPSCFLS